MEWLSIWGMAVGLAMDAFAVSIAVGLAVGRVTPRHVFRIAWHFGLFQFMMPVIGWWTGTRIAGYVASWDHWLACGLLCFIGGKMLFGAFEKHGQGRQADPTRGWLLVTLSVATSIDALAVGLTTAFLNVTIWLPAVIIGVVACAFSAIGITFANKVLGRFGRTAEVMGGLMLILIGIRVCFQHMASS
ncbi:MAG: manganese efflux pump MntP family protein [Phycisphaerae bacterium]|nr:manganese efflux pump MntP family protein [Phycisphaerae bacterium]